MDCLSGGGGSGRGTHCSDVETPINDFTASRTLGGNNIGLSLENTLAGQ